MRRREFLGVLGSAAAWPRIAGAQQQTIPTIGFLHSASRTQYAHLLAAFLHGMEREGYVEGRNVHIEYRWAEGRYDRLLTLAAELVSLKVAVIAAGRESGHEHHTDCLYGRRQPGRRRTRRQFKPPWRQSDRYNHHGFADGVEALGHCSPARTHRYQSDDAGESKIPDGPRRGARHARCCAISRSTDRCS